MPNKYLLVQSNDGRVTEFITGEFENPFIGRDVRRDPRITGYLAWEVVKIFSHEEENTLSAIENLIGLTRLAELFKMKSAL
jgi:hypothetical protein